MNAVRKALPGVGLVLAVAMGARLLSRYTGSIPDVVLALIAGILLRNLIRLPREIGPGVAFTLKYLLRAAIILFGAGLTFEAVLETGGATLLLVVLCASIAMGLGLLFARSFRLPGTIGTLIGAGTAICGGSAILAVGPLMRATDEEIAYAITTIFTFNIVALLLFPPLGHRLHLSSTAFGSWTGTAVNDTSVVVATGFVFSHAAGATATIVKLTRTLLLVPLAIAVGLRYRERVGRESNGAAGSANVWQRVSGTIPWFIFGFVAVVALDSVHVFSSATSHRLTLSAGFLIVMVLAGVGLNVDAFKIARMGLRPLGVGMMLATLMALVSLSLVLVFHIG